jgi:hypothetical protein
VVIATFAMKKRYRLLCRKLRGGAFYCVDSKTGKRTSLGPLTEDEAEQVIAAKNQAERQPMLNLQIAKAYLAGTDSGVSGRTWGDALRELTLTKRDANRRRWGIVAKDRALAALFPKVIIETQAEALLHALRTGTVSTNIYLRRLHNFCLDMNWLPWPILPKRQWPPVRFKDTHERMHKLFVRMLHVWPTAARILRRRYDGWPTFLPLARQRGFWEFEMALRAVV